MRLDILQTRGLWKGKLGKLFFRPILTICYTRRVASAEVAFEDFSLGPDLNCFKWTGVGACPATDALFLIDDDGARSIIQIHGFGYGTGFPADRNTTMPAHED